MRRTNQDIRKTLLKKLAVGQRTINDLSGLAEVNWHTTERHINYLVKKGLVKEVLRASRVRIYELTQRGFRELTK